MNIGFFSTLLALCSVGIGECGGKLRGCVAALEVARPTNVAFLNDLRVAPAVIAYAWTFYASVVYVVAKLKTGNARRRVTGSSEHI